MALLKGRREDVIEGSFFMNATAAAGLCVSFSTGGSGEALDDAAALAAAVTNPSGAVPLGILLYDVVNLDLTKQHINYLKPEVQVGNKVPILRRGWICTDRIVGNPVAGNTCYLNGTGMVSASQAGGAPAIGTFLSSKDADGFAKVEVNLP